VQLFIYNKLNHKTVLFSIAKKYTLFYRLQGGSYDVNGIIKEWRPFVSDKEKIKMNEEQVIKKTKILNTRESLKKDFVKLGIKKGMVLIVHSSLSSIGWVCGGPVAVIQALMDAVTQEGTLVMPAHSGNYSDPSKWQNPPVPKEWINEIKKTMPAFEEDITPTSGIGVIPETFRNFPHVIRSSHPAMSFCAWGKYAQEITENHSIDYSLGKNSPLERVYNLDGYVLLLGVGYGNNTSFHLSEYRATNPKTEKLGAPILNKGIRVWQEYDDIEMDSDLFEELGKDFEKHSKATTGYIGTAESKFFRQKAAVDFGQSWINNKRAQL
jgi:aminoglycoside 3-N-acetyltransferase